VETRQYDFLRQLKEEDIVKVIWTPDELNRYVYKESGTHGFRKIYQGVRWRRQVQYMKV
jgi:hypothetical protein